MKLFALSIHLIAYFKSAVVVVAETPRKVPGRIPPFLSATVVLLKCDGSLKIRAGMASPARWRIETNS